jgi:hypothetical protein
VTLTVSFKKRNFSPRLEAEGVQTRVNSMSWNAVGGCGDASITCFGSVEDLWEMIEYLRCPVEIYDEIGHAVWWGYVSETRVRVGALEIGATLDSMSNKVAVAYSYIQPGTTTTGQRKTTAWSTDTDSSVEYGIKEFLSSQGGLSDSAATGKRDAILTSRRWPQGIANPFGAPRGRVRYSGAEDSQSATLTCKGWWNTLGWRYASISAVTGPSYQTTSATEQKVGEAAGNTKVMMVINTAARGYGALGIQVYARKQGSPTDNLVLTLYQANDDTDVPEGSAIGTVTLAGSGLTGSLAWVGGTFTEGQMNPNKDHCVVVSRSGAADASNYYVVNVNEAKGYASGFFRIYGGSTWAARSPDADMPFILSVNNNVESTSQIIELARTYGEFITATAVDVGSGVILPSYRDGDTLTLAEIEELLEVGGVNARRLLASVDVERRLRIWEEPAATTVAYRLNRDGQLLDRLLGVVDDYAAPVGVWVRLQDVIPGNADVSKLNSPELQFIEGATWSADNGLRLQFRGQPSIEEMFKIKR